MTELTVVGRLITSGQACEIKMHSGVITSITRLSNSADQKLPWLSSGFIDLQVNGYRGHDVNGAQVSVDGIKAITEYLAKEGVTTWVPTIITASEEAICHSLQVVAEARRSDPIIARAIPFTHIEGPFLSDQDGPRGAHNLADIRPIDVSEVKRWMQYGPIGIVTISPHWPGSPEKIAQICQLGIAVSIGHTHASCNEIQDAILAGASLSTHLGNGIFSQLARHPNPIWTQLAADELTAGLIGDGFHLPNETLLAMIRAKGSGKSFLISDSVALAGSKPGIYLTPVGGKVELTAEGKLLTYGTDLLAGAGIGLAAGVKNVFHNLPLGLAEVIELVTTNPALVLTRLGCDGYGKIQLGAVADIVELNKNCEVLGVIRNGERIR